MQLQLTCLAENPIESLIRGDRYQDELLSSYIHVRLIPACILLNLDRRDYYIAGRACASDCLGNWDCVGHFPCLWNLTQRYRLVEKFGNST